MITVKEDAKVFLKGLIDQNNFPEDATIRLAVGPEGLGLKPDKANDEDTTYEHEGRTVLAIGETTATQLDGKSLSINETPDGPALAIE